MQAMRKNDAKFGTSPLLARVSSGNLAISVLVVRPSASAISARMSQTMFSSRMLVSTPCRRTLRVRCSYWIGSALTKNPHMFCSFCSIPAGRGRRWPRVLASDRASSRLRRDVIGLSNGQCHDGQGRILRAAGGELTPVGNEQIGNVVGLAVGIADAVLGRCAHAAGAHVVRRWIRRCAEGLDGAGSPVDAFALSECVVAHRDVVVMLVEMHVRDG